MVRKPKLVIIADRAAEELALRQQRLQKEQEIW